MTRRMDVIEDGLYRCTKGGVVAGVVVERGAVVRWPPVLNSYCQADIAKALLWATWAFQRMRMYGWRVERIAMLDEHTPS